MVDADCEQRAMVAEHPRLRKDLYLEACAAKGATRQEDRILLFGFPRRTLQRYEYDRSVPLTAAVHMASTLERTVDELWAAA